MDLHKYLSHHVTLQTVSLSDHAHGVGTKLVQISRAWSLFQADQTSPSRLKRQLCDAPSCHTVHYSYSAQIVTDLLSNRNPRKLIGDA